MDELVAAANKEGAVVYQTPLESVLHPALIEAFNAKYPDIKVELIEYSGTDGFEAFKAEVAAGAAKVDVITPTVRNVDDLIESDAWAKVDWKALGADAETISDDGYAISWGHRPQGIAYNSKRVSDSDAPKTWEDCLNPRWKGDFIVDTRPLTFVQLMPVMGEQPVLDYAGKLLANKPVFYRGSTAAMEVLAAGEYSMICGAGYDAFKNVSASGANIPIKFVFPDPVPIADRFSYVLSKAEHPNAAALFTRFLQDEATQKILDQVGNALVTSPACSCFAQTEGKKVSHQTGDWVKRDADLNKAVVDIWGDPKPVGK
jgi:ABC-type Fe3+ transport system substrate-binding protein